jgi:TRAP-type C4-dicarboxylate transport system permease small subunit
MSDALAKLLGWADRQLGHIENALNIAAGLVIFALMFLGVAQIILRAVFRDPIYGYIDIVEVSMVGFALMSISYVQRVGGHVRMELIISKFSGRAHWIAELVGACVTASIVAVLIPGSYSHFLRAYNFGDSTIDIELLTWPSKLVVPIALSILLARIFLQILGYLRMFIDPDRAPIAIPVIKSVEELAEEEIELADEKGVVS